MFVCGDSLWLVINCLYTQMLIKGRKIHLRPCVCCCFVFCFFNPNSPTDRWHDGWYGRIKHKRLLAGNDLPQLPALHRWFMSQDMTRRILVWWTWSRRWPEWEAARLLHSLRRGVFPAMGLLKATGKKSRHVDRQNKMHHCLWFILHQNPELSECWQVLVK